MTLRIATRQSPLALAQCALVQDALKKHHPGLTLEVIAMDSAADEDTGARIASFGQEGVFVKALEEALLSGKADIAVHSLKDVPTTLDPALTLGAYLEGEDPRDVLVAKDPAALLKNPQGKRIGTSSLRRKALLSRAVPGLVMEDLRGNLNTRLEKALNGELDGVVVALAGLKRLGRTDVPHHVFSETELPPAVGQGVITVQCRTNDTKTLALLAPLNHTPTAQKSRAAREFLREIQGGCLVPAGVRAEFVEDGLDLLLEAWVASPEGDLLVHGSHAQRKEAPEAIGSILASRLWQHGARQIIHRLRGVEEKTDEGDSAIEPSG